MKNFILLIIFGVILTSQVFASGTYFAPPPQFEESSEKNVTTEPDKESGVNKNEKCKEGDEENCDEKKKEDE